jgi:hypothetical protein
MEDYVNFKRTSPTTIIIHTNQGRHMGQFILDLDGLWYWWPPLETNAYSDHLLKRISDELWLLNRAKTHNIKS